MSVNFTVFYFNLSNKCSSFFVITLLKCSHACDYFCLDDEITNGECWTCWLVLSRPSLPPPTVPAWTWRATGCPRATWSRFWTPATSSPPRSSSTCVTSPEWCLQGRKNSWPCRAAGHPLTRPGSPFPINQGHPYIQTHPGYFWCKQNRLHQDEIPWLTSWTLVQCVTSAEDSAVCDIQSQQITQPVKNSDTSVLCTVATDWKIFEPDLYWWGKMLSKYQTFD